MLDTFGQTGNIIANLYKNDAFKNSQSDIERQAKDIFDIARIRLDNDSIKNVTQSIIPLLFNLRISLLEWVSNEKITINKYFDILHNEIYRHTIYQNHTELNTLLSDILEFNSNILLPYFEDNSSEGFNLKPMIKNIDIKSIYIVLEQLERFPNPQIQYVKKLLDESLKLDFCLMLSDLFLSQKIQLNDERVQELIPFTKQTFIRFGAYAKFTGLIKPDFDADAPYLNSMNILESSLCLKFNIKTQTVSKEDFAKMWEN